MSKDLRVFSTVFVHDVVNFVVCSGRCCVCCVVNVQAVDAVDRDADVENSAAAANEHDNDARSASLAHLGLHIHTVDELLDMDSSLRLQHESDYDSLQSSSRAASPAAAAAPLRSILSVTPRSLTPKSSRSRVRLMDELTEVRSRSPSPVFTARSRSRSVSPVLTARSHSVTSVPDDEVLTASVRTAASDSDSPASNNSDQIASTSEMTACAVTDSETDHRPRRYRSVRRMSEPVSASSSHRSQRRGSRRMSETATMTYSEDFTSARTSVDYSEQTSLLSDDTEHHKRHRRRSSSVHTSYRYAATPVSPPLDNIRVMMIVWKLRGNIIRTALCWIL